jgi:Cytochrome P450
VTEPSLAAAVQRASKALSFTPLVPDITKRVLGLDSKTVRQIRQNLDPEPGDPHGFLADIHDMVYSYLGPGDLLNGFSYDAANELHRQLIIYADGLDRRGVVSETVNLLSWIQHFVTLGTAHFLYGPNNPIAMQPELEQAFWDFDRGLGPLLIDIFPSVTARKPYAGRETIVKAFVRYLEAGHHKTGGSKFIQRRIEITEEYGWDLNNTARSELSFLFAGITNTAITTFWAVLYIFARPELLMAVRMELDATTTSPDPTSRIELSVDSIRNSSPILQAVVRECMRFNSDNFSTRLVKTNTLLADKFFLRAGSVVQIAGGVIHADNSIWGTDAGEWNHERFLAIDRKERQVHPAAFRAFGGGKTLCPGRHFAMSEILSFVAMVVMMFDIEAEVEGEEIKVPEKEDGVLPVHILEPRGGSPKVRVKLRGGERGKIRVVR